MSKILIPLIAAVSVLAILWLSIVGVPDIEGIDPRIKSRMPIYGYVVSSFIAFTIFWRYLRLPLRAILELRHEKKEQEALKKFISEVKRK